MDWVHKITYVSWLVDVRQVVDRGSLDVDNIQSKHKIIWLLMQIQV